MGLFNKKADPIGSKAKALNNQIAALELEIKKLERRALRPESTPAQTPASPQQTITSTPKVTPQQPRVVSREPIFESVEQAAPAMTNGKDPHYNDLGVRKYDLGAAWRRLKTVVSGPATHNPKLVSYLAAGSIRGLRPLRYEKRIARNRFIALTLFFIVILWSMLGLFFNRR